LAAAVSGDFTSKKRKATSDVQSALPRKHPSATSASLGALGEKMDHFTNTFASTVGAMNGQVPGLLRTPQQKDAACRRLLQLQWSPSLLTASNKFDINRLFTKDVNYADEFLSIADDQEDDLVIWVTHMKKVDE
jgi:hypothetical protein